MPTLQMIDLNQIKCSFRRRINPLLLESINDNGILNPISVRKITDGYEVIIGVGRFLVARQLNIKQIPCIVYKNISDSQLAEIRNYNPR